MSLVDLPYFWGGKHPRKGRHPAWGKPRVVQAPNNWASNGNPIPFGMDCSGYVDWVYYQMIGKTIGRGGGTTAQFSNSYAIKESELKIGDLGFYGVGGGGHVGIYVGELNGKKLFIHSGGRTWRAEGLPAGRVVITYNKTTQRYKGNTSSRFTHFRRPYVSFANE